MTALDVFIAIDTAICAVGLTVWLIVHLGMLRTLVLGDRATEKTTPPGAEQPPRAS